MNALSIALLTVTNLTLPVMNVMNNELQKTPLRGELLLNEPMSKHTSWRVGGCARQFYKPKDIPDLTAFLQSLPIHESIYFVGLGSNLLVRDGGLAGTVIGLHAQLDELRVIECDEATGLIYAGAGVACAKLARFAAKHGLVGMEFLVGIPGTVGGALAMNAGCFGAETWQNVECVRVVHRDGQVDQHDKNAYTIGYRHIELHIDNTPNAEWFVGGYFRLSRGKAFESEQKIKQLLAQRIDSQPLNQPNAGSVFRNPTGDYAARLIESCELKGKAIGGAMVSTKHANFIVNTGNARATDIEMLIALIQRTVMEKTGVELIREVHIVGEPREHC